MNSFFVEGLRHLYQVGTVVPSSRWLARAMVQSLHANGAPKRVLEVGAGTGAVTRRILPLLRDGDELHLVELNPIFCKHLERRVLRKYRAAHPGVRIVLHNASIASAPLEGKFAPVICTLPFRAFLPHRVLDILDRLAALTDKGGDVTFMQYAGVRYFLGPFSSRTRRRDLWRIDAICRSVERQNGGKREFILLNILPSFVVRFAVNGRGRDSCVSAAHLRRRRRAMAGRGDHAA